MRVQYFAPGLGQQQVARIESGQYVEQQAAGGLQLAHRAWRATGQRGRQQAGDAGDVAELPARQFGHVQRRLQVVQQVARVQQPAELEGVQRMWGLRGEREAVIVHREAEGVRLQAAPAQGEQGGQPFMHGAARERVEEQVPAFAGGELLHQ